MEIEEYFQRIINYENKDNLYHPDQIDKNNDINFIKMAYRAKYEMQDFHIKNMARNYLDKIKEIENGEKRERT